MGDGEGPTLNPKTKPVDIFPLSKAEAFLGGAFTIQVASIMAQ